MSRELRHYEPAPTVEVSQPPAQQTIELRRLLAAVRRQRWTIILPMILMGALGFIYAKSKPYTYTAASTLLLDGAMSNAVRQVGGIENRALPADTIENARVVLTSDKLALDVLDITQLDKQEDFLVPRQSRLSQAIGSVTGLLTWPVTWAREQVGQLAEPPLPATDGGLPLGTAAAPGAEPVDPARRAAAAMLQRNLVVSRVGRSGAVAIGFTSLDPTWSAAVANAYAVAYTEDILNANAQSVGQTTSWMDGRLEDLRARAQAAAEAAEEFAAANQLAMTSTGALLGEQAQSELNANLTAAISERARAQAVLDIYDRVVEGGVENLQSGASLSIGGAVSDTLRARLDTYNDVTSRLQQLIESSGPDHPQVAGLRQTLASAADRLFIELQAQRQSAETELRVAEERVSALRRSLDEVTNENSSQAAALVRLRALQQEAETLATLYQNTLANAQEIEQQSSFPVSNVRVLSFAQVPTGPSGPASKRIAIAAALLGLFFGLARAALREGRETHLRTAADVTDYSPLRFLGYLPVLGRGRPMRPDRARSQPKTRPVIRRADGGRLPVVSAPKIPPVPVPVLHHPDSIYAETLRHIRLAASRLSGDTAPITGVTSFHPYQGRALVTLNLAGQIAATSGKRVLLIDTDGRGRRLSHLLGVTDKPGLSDLPETATDWRSMLHDVTDSQLTVLPCGQGSKGAGDDLVLAKALRKVLSEVDDRYGHVILDVPPLYPVAQGMAVLRELPGCVIVAEWGETPRDMIDLVLANLPELETTCLGVVYDRVVPRRLKSYLAPGSVEHMLVSSRA
ncbi:GNVR domain-containing protein [Paracoccus sp. T5]|uniref:GNVR domain-containing protein n=1 Tax=Paracoccus sp. T5 TaxID=3402161 RepID=UPI003ADBCC91